MVHWHWLFAGIGIVTGTYNGAGIGTGTYYTQKFHEQMCDGGDDDAHCFPIVLTIAYQMVYPLSTHV